MSKSMNPEQNKSDTYSSRPEDTVVGAGTMDHRTITKQGEINDGHDQLRKGTGIRHYQQISTSKEDNDKVTLPLHQNFIGDDTQLSLGSTRSSKLVDGIELQKQHIASFRFDRDTQLSFPQKLMCLLGNEALSDIAGWLPHGKSFRIHDTKRFEDEVCPTYFGQRSKFASFARKLNRWNFSRLTKGTDAGAFYHPNFQRGNWAMCADITSASNVVNDSEPINPHIALSIATPAMIRHGLIDQRVASRSPADEPNSSFLLGVDPQLLQPRPIHPRLELRRHSEDTPVKPDANIRQQSIPSFQRSQSLPPHANPRIAHYLSQLEESKRQAELEHYHRDRMHFPHSQASILDYTIQSIDPSARASAPAPQADALTSQTTNEHEQNTSASLDLNPITMLSKSPDVTLFATGAPVSTTNSSYSDMLEPYTHLDALDDSRHDLLTMYIQQQQQQQDDMTEPGEPNWSAGDHRHYGSSE